jgi:hypothetical protein
MRERLEAAWNVAHNNEKAPWHVMVNAPGIIRFLRLLDAEAWLDAAVMLLPANTLWAVVDMEDGPIARVCWPVANGGYLGGYIEATAPTPAEALLAAIERGESKEPKA